MIEFQNYHIHCDTSNVIVSDCAVTLEDYAKRAVELGHKILSSCAHGWQGNVWQTVKIARKYGLKPIVVAEAYWVKNRLEKDETNCHIIIIAKNENGRQALNDILSEANITGFYYKARVDIPLLLSLPPKDVIVTTACVAFHKYEDVDELILQFYNHFKDNFYLEVQPHYTNKQIELNTHLLEIHNKYHIPLIAGCDSHYIFPNDNQTRTDFLLSKKISYPDEDGWDLDYPDGNTLYDRFAKQCVLSHDDIMEAIHNTNKLLEVEDYKESIFDTAIKMPSLYPNWTQEQKDNEYKRIIYESWNEYKKEVPEDKWKLYEQEIANEVQIVIDTHMSDYFLCNYYIIKRGKENGGWLTKSGRGSAVSFFTNKLLGFTEVDRIVASVKMFPERFMSTTRILESGSLPDIDFNIAPAEPFAKAQQEILGEDHAYPMIAYGTMKKSSAWKLYAKAQGIPFEIANAVSEQIQKYEKALEHADEDDKEDIDIMDYISSEFQVIYNESSKYLNLIASCSVAPCSYLLYDGNIRKDFGLIKINKHLCCTMDGHYAEECHFLKNDLLKVSVVDLIYKVYRAIGEQPPDVRKLLELCENDEDVWNIYAKSCTIGINQVEQVGTAQRIAKYKPQNISELCAFVAAIRPGFKSMYKTFESKEPFSYGIKTFDDLIQTKEMPNSFILYQEQVMALLHYAGIPMVECYGAIKNIAKKRVEKVLAYKEQFMKGFVQVLEYQENKNHDIAISMAEQLWQLIEDNSKYSFNCSHSYCVALDSLYSAYLKAHYPIEFYTEYLKIQEEKGNKDKMNAAKQEAEDYFKINFPALRFGQDNRKITANKEKNSITNSLSSIKGFGKNMGEIIYECSQQNYSFFIDVLKWLDEKSIKSAKLEDLILVDYFQQFGNSKQLIMILKAWDFLKQGNAKQIKKDADLPEDLLKFVKLYSADKRADGTESSSYKLLNVMQCLYDYEKYILSANIYDYDLHEKIKKSQEILGYINVITNKEEDRRKLLITDLTPINGYNGKGVWAYRIGTTSLGSGKASRLTLKKDVFDNKPIKIDDIIIADDVYKNQQGYWYLTKYRVL